MKKSELRQIIREEISKVLKENKIQIFVGAGDVGSIYGKDGDEIAFEVMNLAKSNGIEITQINPSRFEITDGPKTNIFIRNLKSEYGMHKVKVI